MGILTGDMEHCFVCKAQPVEMHHILHGRRRRHADANDFKVPLCAFHHRGAYGVHGKYGHTLDKSLKCRLQKALFEQYREESVVREMMGGKLELTPGGEIAGLVAKDTGIQCAFEPCD